MSCWKCETPQGGGCHKCTSHAPEDEVRVDALVMVKGGMNGTTVYELPILTSKKPEYAVEDKSGRWLDMETGEDLGFGGNYTEAIPAKP